MKCPKCKSNFYVLSSDNITHISSLEFEPGNMIPVQVKVKTTKIYTCTYCYTKVTTFEDNFYNKEIKYNRAEEEV